jgi:murein DD-endopeptidase MepM/ murein hydrolase activator NlpD
MTVRMPVVVGTALALLGAGSALASPYAQAGDWVWPLAGPHAVGRPFAPPASRYGPGHRGADLPGSPGQAVRAAGAGRISYAGLLAGRGVVVVVHGDLRTTYEPVAALVRVGQQVTAGQLIGRLAEGHAGCPRACLHWGLLRGDVYLDPVRLVRAGPSRLLPLDTGVPTDRTPALGMPVAAGPPVGPAGTRPAAGTPPPAEPSPAPGPAVDPAFALRAADAAWGAGALLALLAGLVLVRRPPAPEGPSEPASGTPVAGTGSRGPTEVDLPPGAAVDLASERHRRRPSVA